MVPPQLEVLRSSALFDGMSDAELTALAPIFQEKQMEEGTTVFLENMPGESLYLIQQGTVEISKMIAEGEEKTLIILGAEDVFGELTILDGGPRSATARIAENARLLSIRRSDFETLCEKNPPLGLKLMRNIVRLFSQRVRENSNEYRRMLVWSLGKTP